MEKFLKECQNHQLDEGSILIVNGCRDNLRNHKNLARSHPDASKRSEIFTKISNILKKDLRQLNDSEKLIKTREFLSLKEELKIIDKKIYADILSSTKVLIFASENDIDQYIEMGFKPDAQIVLNLNYCVEHQFLNIIRQVMLFKRPKDLRQ
jgi:hypothetical protein